MKPINAILACDDRGGIGKNNALPWPHNSKDLQWFKSNTVGGIVIMGSSTWASEGMPKPLPYRKNIVITSCPEKFPGAHDYIETQINEQIKLINNLTDEPVWIIGGASIIEQTLGIIDRFYLSRIPGDYNCDTFLPLGKIKSLFKCVHTEMHDNIKFEIWEKIVVHC